MAFSHIRDDVINRGKQGAYHACNHAPQLHRDFDRDRGAKLYIAHFNGKYTSIKK